MDHLSDNTLVQLVDGHLPAEALRRVHQHVDACADCRTLLAELMQGESTASPEAVQLTSQTLPSSRAPSTEHPQLLGRYVLVSLIGEGGMGEVFAAFDPYLDRRIALKLLRISEVDAVNVGGHGRLLREAQAMARLAHPNVVTVHDVGTVDGRLYLAMEFVPGGTLQEWLRQAERPWREILARFLDAGRGLRAAHAAGIVHRDFKPSNVLIDTQGHAKVSDFGLARGVTELVNSTPLPIEVPPLAPFTDSNGLTTRPGVLMGTPAFLAPEQLFGEPADARTDQFNFCVALYQSLFGVPPFERADLQKRKSQIETRAFAPPLKGNDVPRRVRQALVRGMCYSAEERFPSMDALLEALRPPVRPSWVALSAVATAALGLVVGGWIVLEQRAADARLCTDGQEQLGSAWTSARAGAIREAFLGTKVPTAAAASDWVNERLHAYAKSWVDTYASACAATRVTRSQTEAVLTRRLECLADRRRALDATAGVLSAADAVVVESAVRTVNALPDVAFCDELQVLAHEPEPPSDPQLRVKVDALRRRFAEAEVLAVAGRETEAMARIAELIAEGRRTGYDPVLVPLLLRAHALHRRHATGEASAATLHEALLIAERNHDDVGSATARIALAGDLTKENRLEDAATAFEFAEAALARAGRPRRLEITYLNWRATHHEQVGDTQAAVEAFRRSVVLAEQIAGRKSALVQSQLGNLAASLTWVGRYEEAAEAARQSLELAMKVLPEHHPELARAYQNRSATLSRLPGRLEESNAAAQKSLDLLDRYVPTSHPVRIMALQNVAAGKATAGQMEEASRLYEEALALLASREEGGYSDSVYILQSYGEAFLENGLASKARAVFERGMTVADVALGARHARKGLLHNGLAEAALLAGDFKASVAHAEQGRSMMVEGHSEPGDVALNRFLLAVATYARTRQDSRALASVRAAYENLLNHDPTQEVVARATTLLKRFGTSANTTP